MRDYLIFQLYGPLASWGDIAVGETRPSALTPTRSAVLGLTAAALGVQRPDTVSDPGQRAELEAKHAALEGGYGLALKVEALGSLLIDYHTAEVPKGQGFFTRREELAAVGIQKRKGNFKGTILSRREYRQDGWWVCALWARPVAPYTLRELCARFAAPHFVLYLGRKSCPIALPLSPKLVRAEWVEDALKEHSLQKVLEGLWPDSLKDARRLAEKLQTATGLMAWDSDAETRMPCGETIARRDAPLSRLRWQFAVRNEHRLHLSEEVRL
jgi:CRISPR system Cascade subunit CasD